MYTQTHKLTVVSGKWNTRPEIQAKATICREVQPKVHRRNAADDITLTIIIIIIIIIMIIIIIILFIFILVILVILIMLLSIILLIIVSTTIFELSTSGVQSRAPRRSRRPSGEKTSGPSERRKSGSSECVYIYIYIYV